MAVNGKTVRPSTLPGTALEDAPNGVPAGKINDDAVETSTVADGNITEAKIGAGAVTETKLGALAVATAKLAADAVDDTKLADNAVGNEHLQDGAVDTAELATGAVTPNEADRGAGQDWDFSGADSVTVPAPSSSGHAATKAYADSIAAGVRDPKDACQAATTQQLTDEGGTPVYNNVGGASGRGQITWTTGPTTLDGVTLVNGMRILVKDEGGLGADANGIYERTAQNTWDRATDFDEDAEVTNGAWTSITGGTANEQSTWLLTTADPITIGGASSPSNITFAQGPAPTDLMAGAGLTRSGKDLNVGDVNKGVQVNADDIQVDASEIAGDGIEQLAGGGNEHIAKVQARSAGAANIAESIDVSASGVAVKVDDESVDADGSGRLKSAVPTTGDKYMTGFTYTQIGATDYYETDMAISAKPARDSDIRIIVSSLDEALAHADGDKANRSGYFADPAGSPYATPPTARAIADIQAGDLFIWNKDRSGYDLDNAAPPSGDYVDFLYLVL